MTLLIPTKWLAAQASQRPVMYGNVLGSPYSAWLPATAGRHLQNKAPQGPFPTLLRVNLRQREDVTKHLSKDYARWKKPGLDQPTTLIFCKWRDLSIFQERDLDTVFALSRISISIGRKSFARGPYEYTLFRRGWSRFQRKVWPNSHF